MSLVSCASHVAPYSNRGVGLIGRAPSTSNLINMMPRGCLVHPSQYHKRMTSSTLFGPMQLRLSMTKIIMLCMRQVHTFKNGSYTCQDLWQLRQPNQFPSLLCHLCSQEYVNLWCQRFQCFRRSPPPKQGFFMRPDKAFHDWWVLHKHHPPIPEG